MATLSALIYRSTARSPFGPDELTDLADRSASKNASVGISGYLSYRDMRFTQYLEGPEPALAELMRAIRSDDRHTVDITVDLDVDERRFPQWSMRVLRPMWHPTSTAPEVIDELLFTSSGTTLDDEVTRGPLVELLNSFSKLAEME